MTVPPEKASLRGAAYDRAMRAIRAMSPLVNSRLGAVLIDPRSKVSEGVRGRRVAAGELEEWGRRQRDRGRPLVWFHAPSVGEGLQARAVMEALLEARPDLQLAFTFFSPSARALAERMPARVSSYLPWDTQDELASVLEALDPELVVFTKTEVWPGLSAAAASRGVPTALVAATLPAGAGRLRWPGPHLLRPAFGRLGGVGTISPEDGERFGRLGVKPERVTVTGDPGIDSAVQRAGGADPRASYLAPFLRWDAASGEFAPSLPTLVAGSTWGPDEDVLVPAFAAARIAHPRLRMIIAPHEPDDPHLRRLEARLLEHRLVSRRLSEVEGEVEAGGEELGADPGAGGERRAEGRTDAEPGAGVEAEEEVELDAEPRAGVDEDEGGVSGRTDVVVVDRVGVLAHLYKAGTFSYVGGGFHRHGLHSVLEPAAARLPVLFGPRHANSRAAQDLVQRGGARVVGSSREITGILAEWMDSPKLREGVAGVAAEYIAEHRGAARTSAEMLMKLMDGR